MRFPIPMAKKLGEITANYRWFAVVYIIAAFFLIPLMIFALSLAGWYVFAGVLGPMVLLLIIVIIINLLQAHVPTRLPAWLQTWKWLPRPLRSLAWYDEHLCAKRCCLCCKRRSISAKMDDDYCVNESYVDDVQVF